MWVGGTAAEPITREPASLSSQPFVSSLPKAPTGIRGLDEITGGGLPHGRPTLLCGGPGCGKTLLATEFLVRGAVDYGEPGVFMSFEETAPDLGANAASLGFDLDRLVADGQLRIDHVRIERSEIEEAGDYDLEGLFVRLGHAIDTIGAKRVVIDTIEALFSGFSNEGILRAELRRLLHWLKDRGVTAIITGERGATTLTRHGLEEYVSDCVIALDHRVQGEVSTRRLRIVKYRGSDHGTNEYPFVIETDGFTVIPITSATLDHAVSEERISTGIAELDEMLGGKGYYRGTSVLVSGTAGSGKTTTAAHMVDAACRRGERVLMFTFEESADQVLRNMRSVNIDLQTWREKGLLKIDAARVSLFGLERHLSRMLRLLYEFRPEFVVIDPISALLDGIDREGVARMAVRLIDTIKREGATLVLTSLTAAVEGRAQEATDIGISSIVDAWVLLRDIESNGERNRLIHILKARGIGHSNQVREFQLTDRGVRLVPAYIGPDGVLTGSARVQQAARAEREATQRAFEIEARRARLAYRRAALQARIEALRAELEAETAQFENLLERDREHAAHLSRAAVAMANSRGATRREASPARTGPTADTPLERSRR